MVMLYNLFINLILNVPSSGDINSQWSEKRPVGGHMLFYSDSDHHHDTIVEERMCIN